MDEPFCETDRAKKGIMDYLPIVDGTWKTDERTAPRFPNGTRLSHVGCKSEPEEYASFTPHHSTILPAVFLFIPDHRPPFLCLLFPKEIPLETELFCHTAFLPAW
jgi:hypothetical protein